MKIGIIFTILGIMLIGYSLTLEPFTDVNLFMEKYMSMNYEQSEEFFALRDEMLTSKYRLQDTGITLILFSFGIMLLLKVGGGRLYSIPKRSFFITLAIALPFLTVAGFVFDLFQGMYRNEFPHWADSLGIPLMGVPIQLGILLIWSFAHLSLVQNIKAFPLRIAMTKRLNSWILFISFITLLLTLSSAYYGRYWYAFPGLLWLYYYLSIGGSRLETQGT